MTTKNCDSQASLEWFSQFWFEYDLTSILDVLSDTNLNILMIECFRYNWMDRGTNFIDRKSIVIAKSGCKFQLSLCDLRVQQCNSVHFFDMDDR